MTSVNRIVCVSNRLPITVIEEPDRIDLQPSSGGLVTAMAPVLRKCRGVWIGWPGEIKSEERVIRKALSEFSSRSEFDLIPVLLDKNAIEKFYYGFSNQVIWPLFHELQSRCNFEPEFWSTYLEVQQVFCDEVVKHIRPGDLIWIHDYHLMGVARLLRERNVINTICFFLHTPFPGYNIFSKLPSRSDVIDSLINCNLIGFQTDKDLTHFADAVESLLEVKCDKTSSGVTVVNLEQQECKLGSFPVSIDFAEFDDMARLPEVEANAQ
ncbi:MAG: trehalose-6-phosphate synthase, partial [Deltaproteobacteria bacterium]|nr:trehalose-6-phosphate synthase [Deltaproteobacteria bacterium]